MLQGFFLPFRDGQRSFGLWLLVSDLRHFLIFGNPFSLVSLLLGADPRRQDGNPDELLRLVDTKDFSKNVDGTKKHLDSIDRELFLVKDPDLSTFNQGRLADCYFLSPIAAMAHRNARSIHDMIHPEVTGGFQVHFGDGQKIHISPLTDAELLIGARLDERHGSWLAVLEKAYGIVRKKEKAKKGEKATGSEPIQSLNYGDSEPVIAMLTGHKAEKLMLAKSNQDQVHTLFQRVTQRRHLTCIGKGDAPKIPGLVDGHIYAIMGYDPKGRHVNIFNPWGNNFTPKGDPGKSNGLSYQERSIHRAAGPILFNLQRRDP